MLRYAVFGPALVGLAACTPPSTDVPTDPGPTPLSFRAITYNTGTSEGLPHADLSDGYGEEQALTSDTWYGDGLAFVPAVEAATAFLARMDADVIAFQEIFDPTECAGIPVDQHADFICDGWTAADGTVAEQITGAGYQVFCHPGKSDKCIAVHERFGNIGPLEGREVEGCGSGARVAAAVIPDLLTIVSVHGSSGIAGEDQDCRSEQVDAIFEDPPLVGPGPTLILGDLNTDPGRWDPLDVSAATWNEYVGPGTDFAWLTEVGPDVEPTYQGIVNIDHMAGSGLTATSCLTEGVTAGTSPVFDGVYFDHHPVVCDLEIP